MRRRFTGILSAFADGELQQRGQARPVEPGANQRRRETCLADLDFQIVFDDVSALVLFRHKRTDERAEAAIGLVRKPRPNHVHCLGKRDASFGAPLVECALQSLLQHRQRRREPAFERVRLLIFDSIDGVPIGLRVRPRERSANLRLDCSRARVDVVHERAPRGTSFVYVSPPLQKRLPGGIRGDGVSRHHLQRR
jgi:hypothetical protein